MPKTYTYDNSLLMKDAGAVTASAGAQVAAAARVLDLGLGAIEGTVVADVSAIDTVSADEKYEIEWQLSSSSTFASDVNVAAVLKLGDSGQTGGSADNTTGRYELRVSNEFKGTTYRYARLYHRIAGTTPSINYAAFLGKVLATG
jgi:hypothetical protein